MCTVWIAVGYLADEKKGELKPSEVSHIYNEGNTVKLKTGLFFFSSHASVLKEKHDLCFHFWKKESSI